VATKSKPAVVAPVKVDPQAALSDHAAEVFCGKSGMIGLKAAVYALAVVDGKVVEIPMGNLQGVPRVNKTGSRGFFLNGKINDPTLIGQANTTRFQFGGNVTAVGSKDW